MEKIIGNVKEERVPIGEDFNARIRMRGPLRSKERGRGNEEAKV